MRLRSWGALGTVIPLAGILVISACNRQPAEPGVGTVATAPETERRDKSNRPRFPSGRMLGTFYFGEPLDWQDPQVREEILQLDFLITGESLRSSAQYEGMVASLHAEDPGLKIIQYVSFPWIWDVCNPPNPPAQLPCTELGQMLYQVFHPDHIAHIVPANPHPAVLDTAFHLDGYYLIDLDDPGVPETIAAILHSFITTGNNPDIDGVMLDFMQAKWGGWCMYGNLPGHHGYGDGPYWLDYDRDGIPVNTDPDEAGKVRDATGQLVDALHALFGNDFLVTANGVDATIGGPMSDGTDVATILDGAITEQFPMYWYPYDYWLAAFALLGNARADGQDAWEIAAKGTNNHFIPTPPGNYWFMDTFNVQNNPWICVAALLFDNCVATIAGNPDDHREEWCGGDPMPRLDELGEPLAPPTIDEDLITREFEGGTVYLEFSNVPAELLVEPWSGGTIHAPDGPFKYLVMATSPDDTLYRGGTWPRRNPGPSGKGPALHDDGRSF